MSQVAGVSTVRKLLGGGKKRGGSERGRGREAGEESYVLPSLPSSTLVCSILPVLAASGYEPPLHCSSTCISRGHAYVHELQRC